MFALLVLLLLTFTSPAAAFPGLRSLIPNGYLVWRNGVRWPAVGHDLRFGGEVLNPFGASFRSNLMKWNSTFCTADADGDGYSNGEELGDPDCEWTIGAEAETDAWTIVSHPGFNDSIPTASISEVSGDFVRLLAGAPVAAQLGASYRQWTAAGAPLCVAAQQFNRFACDFTNVAPALRPLLNLTVWPQGISDVTVSGQAATGTFDMSELRDLPIRAVNFSNNSLTGNLIAADLPRRLEVLDLSDNLMSGMLNLSGLPPGLQYLDVSGNGFDTVVLPTATPPNTTLIVGRAGQRVARVELICGAPHPSLTFATDFGVATLDANALVPAHCASGCNAGDVLDVATAACVVVRAAVTPAVSSAAQGSVSTRDDVYNYCDDGCTAAVVLFVIVLVALIVFVVVFKACCEPDDEVDDHDPATLVGATKTVDHQRDAPSSTADVSSRQARHATEVEYEETTTTTVVVESQATSNRYTVPPQG